MKKIAPCAILLAFALAFVGCNLQDEPEQSVTLQDALNAGGTVNLDDYPFSRDETYTISGTSIITGDAKGTSFIIADGADVTFDGTKDIGTVTAGNSTDRNAAVRAATRASGIKISLKGSDVTIGKVFITVACTFSSDNADNSFGSVVVAETVTSLTLEGKTNVSALVSTGEASVKITVSAEVTIEKADATMLGAVTKAAEESGISIVIPQPIPKDELKALQDAFEESKKNPADSNPGNTTPGNDDNTTPGGNDNDDKDNVGIIPRGSRIAATYEQKMLLAFYADDTAVMSWGWPVSGTYTKEANGDLTVRMPFESDAGDSGAYLAKINGNTMMLYYYDEDENLNEDALTLTKKATNSDPSALTEWEYNDPLSLTFALDGTVQFFEDSALCWTGTYTVTEDDTAVTNDIRQVGNPWGEDNLTSPPLKVEFDFSYKDALSPNVFTDKSGGWSPFLTRVGDMTVKTPTSGDNTSETHPGNNDDDDDTDISSGTTPGSNTETTPDGNDDDKNNVDIIPCGSRIAAMYVQKAEIALYADGTAVFTMALPVSGTYTKEANGDLTVHIPFSSDSSDEMVEVAKINGDTLSLYAYNEDGSLNEEETTTFTKKVTNSDPSALTEWEWNGSLSLTFALDGTVQFFEDSALCWTGTYTVTKDNFAVTEDVRQVGNPWADMTLPEKVEFTFDGNALMWDVLYGDGGCSSFFTQAGDITVEAPTSDKES